VISHYMSCALWEGSMKSCLVFAIAFLSVCGGSQGQDLRITQGLVDHQVLQRGPGNSADLRISGVAADAEGRNVEARILDKGIEIAGVPWSSVARVERGRWSGQVRKIPAGGPYRLELRVAGSAHSRTVEDVLVGDLWVLGGQSNMEGCGNLENVEAPHPLVHNFDLTDQWLVAQEPLHRLSDAVDPVHWDGKPRVEGAELQQAVAKIWRGTGVGLPFAVEMVRRTGVPVGLIPCAHGGSTMNQWDPRLKDKAAIRYMARCCAGSAPRAAKWRACFGTRANRKRSRRRSPSFNLSLKISLHLYGRISVSRCCPSITCRSAAL
jgi:sialate O-acetylesterase